MNMIHCELCCYSSSPGAPYSVQREQADRVKEEQIKRQSNAIITTEDVDQPVSNCIILSCISMIIIVTSDKKH